MRNVHQALLLFPTVGGTYKYRLQGEVNAMKVDQVERLVSQKHQPKDTQEYIENLPTQKNAQSAGAIKQYVADEPESTTAPGESKTVDISLAWFGVAFFAMCLGLLAWLMYTTGKEFIAG
jgi:hypothetical protein